MNYHFTLCDDCNKEVAIKNGKKYDHSYYKQHTSEHTCTDKQVTYAEQHNGLIRGNA